ncbi:MAG: putative sugar O-methyltransferase [Stenotrophobium sp.]
MKRSVGSRFLSGAKVRISGYLQRVGYNVYRLRDEDRRYLELQQQEPPVAQAIFGAALPRLQELRDRYAKVQLPVALHSVWHTRERTVDTTDMGWGTVDLRKFRANNAYIFSYLRNDPFVSRLVYFIFADAVRGKDAAGLLNSLTEDGAFGCQTCEYPGIGRVSRDLLDSVLELNFLHRHLRVLERSDLRVLDIGAGYGRMAYRMLTANPAVRTYTCVDAVPESTFLSEFYLKHRGLSGKTRVVPLDEVEQHFEQAEGYDLALNIHSFSECTYAAVEWWLTRVAQMGVRHLMIIPNESEEFLATEPDFTKKDFLPLIEKLGYRLIVKEPVFDDPAVRELMGVMDHMFLFELQKTETI